MMQSTAFPRNDSSRATKSSSQSGGIWVVVDYAPTKRGSMEQQLLALATRLRVDGVPLTYVFAGAPAAWMTVGLDELGVTTRTLDFRARTAPLTFLRWVATAPPQVVHFHFVSAYSPLVVLARAAGARTIVNDHFPLGFGYVTPGLVRAPTRAALVDLAKRVRAAALNGLVDRRVAVSRFVAETVAAAEFVAPTRLRIIENGIDIDRFAASDGRASARRELAVGDAAVVVCISRLASREKGIDTLLRAHARLGRGAILLLVGGGPDETELRALADELGTSAHVRFLGVRDDVERLLAAADAVVQPSRYDEAFGMAVVEAMAAGRPIVVTASGAMPELVDFGRAGIVVPKDDSEAMTHAIRRLLDDGSLATRLAAAARTRAHGYAMAPFIARVVALYREVCPSLVHAPVPQTPLPKCR